MPPISVFSAGLRPALNEKFYCSIISLLFFFREVASWDFSTLAMVVKTFAANPMLVARVCTSTVLLVDFSSGTLIFLLHRNHLMQLLQTPPENQKDLIQI